VQNIYRTTAFQCSPIGTFICFGQFFENDRSSQKILGDIFSLGKSNALILTKNGLGYLHFGRFFHKRIWSPCSHLLNTIVQPVSFSSSSTRYSEILLWGGATFFCDHPPILRNIFERTLRMKRVKVYQYWFSWPLCVVYKII
jgi:hypothetical protein